MTWVYAYDPYIWPSLITVLLLIALAFYSWQRRTVPGALPFAIGALLGALWAFGSLMEIAAGNEATHIFWMEFQAVLQLPAVTAITCFVLEYTWPGRWLTRRNLVLLIVMPLLYLGVVLTNDLHHLIWQGFVFDGTFSPLRGPVNWIFIAYGYALGIINIYLFCWLYVHSPSHRLPVVIMLVGQVGARLVYMLELMRVFQSDLPLDVLFLAYVFLIYAITLFGFHIFEPDQVARQMAVTQMKEGMLVLDPDRKVTSINLAAETILGAPAGSILGRPVQELLPVYNEIGDDQKELVAYPIEIQHGSGAEVHYYSLESTALKDWRGIKLGYLLLLHDVTKLKQSQDQIVGQQRTQAVLQERVRLAREMHDSLGQTLAATQLRASTARMLLAKGETSKTDRYLEEVVKLTLAAEIDVRDYLLGAKFAYSDDRPFFSALCLYLTQFGQQHGLQVTLISPPHLEVQGLDAAVEMQLTRVIQEALSNVRKHACAKNVKVEFVDSDPYLQISIRDDGRGFDPGAAERQANGYGLQAMRDRVEDLGGKLWVVSQPDQGTKVAMRLPANVAYSAATKVGSLDQSRYL